jgi:hypothetical protein
MSAPQNTREQILKAFQDNLYVIHRHTFEITPQESLIEPPFRGNTINWVIGHIVVGRDEVLNLLDARPVMTHPVDIETYQSGSDPQAPGYKPMPFNRLMDHLNESQKRLEKALSRMPNAAFAKTIQTPKGPRSLLEVINGLHWHETYHAGQLELLRQLAGRNDAIL